MSLPEKDFAERSRSIFEQLRAQTDAETDETPVAEEAPAEVHDRLGPALAREDLPPPDEADDPEPGDTTDTTDTTDLGTSWEAEDAELAVADSPDLHSGEVALVADEEEPSSTPDLAPVDADTDLETDAVAAPAWSDEVPANLETATADLVVEDLVVADVAPTTGDAPPPDPQRFVRPLPRVLAIANQKGGVGKTTTTVNLGASLAVLGYRVLVIDLDPQGNATTGLGINSRNLETSIYDVILHDTPLDDCVEPTTLRNLFVAPATIDLAGAEIELVPAFSREQRLKRALAEVKDDYEFVLIDCPPSLGLLTVNALSAASEVVVPIQCEYYALEGLGQLLRNINLVQSNLNPTLELSAIILTMYDARTKLAEQVADEVRQHFGDRVCRNVVPRTVRLSEAPSFGQPIIVFDPSSRGALAYRELATEVSGGPPQRTG